MQKYIIWGYKLCRNIIPNLTTSSYFQLKELKEIYPYKKVKYTSFPSLITSLIINGKKMPLEVSGLKEYILFFKKICDFFIFYKTIYSNNVFIMSFNIKASTIPFFEDNATLNVVLFKVNDIDDLERKMKSLIFGKNLSVDPTSYLNIYGEGTLINSYWGLYED